MSIRFEEHISKLNEEELSDLINAFPLITILIAGADGKIHPKELNWAQKVSHIRSYNEDYELQDLFERVDEKFSDLLMSFLENMPEKLDERYNWLSPQLSKLNGILAKLPHKLSYNIYNSLISFAEHVAKAEGGFLIFSSINSEEDKLINLPMIDAIAEPEALEEE